MKINKSLGKRFAAAAIGLSSAIVMLSSVGTVYADNKTYTYSTDKVKWTQIADDTWTADVNGDNRTDVTMKSSTDANGNDVWTYTFNVEDRDLAYYVYENMFGNQPVTKLKDNYTAKGSDSKMGVEADPGQIDPKTHTYTITNSKNHTPPTKKETGSLRVIKRVNEQPVAMPNPDQLFTFDITLTGTTDVSRKDLQGAKVFGSVPFVDGKARVSLKKDQEADMTDIPVGARWTISEEVPAGYLTPTSTNATGSIVKDADKNTWIDAETSVWTNKPQSGDDNPNEKVGSWTLTKKVVGPSAPADGTYTFNVLVGGLKSGQSYAYTVNGKAEHLTADNSGSADLQVKLKNGQSASFRDYPENSTYQVSETAGNYTASYEAVNTGVGNIASSDGANTVANKALSTAKETVDANEDAAITYTNTYPSIQNLTIKKMMREKQKDGSYREYADKNMAFNYTVEFFGLTSRDVIMSPEKTRLIPDEYGEIVYDIDNLPADGTEKTFTNIPAGTQYKVTENRKSGYKGTYSITTKDTNGKAMNGTYVQQTAEGNPGQNLETGSNGENETLEENQSDTVKFVNEYAGYNFGILKKSGTGNNARALSGAEFELYEYKDGKLSLVDSKRTTDANGFAGWSGLNSDSVFALIETKAPKGHGVYQNIIFQKQEDGSIKYAETSSAQAEADAKHLDNSQWLASHMKTWKVSNKEYNDANSGMIYEVYDLSDAPLPQLPKTGGIGLYILLGAFGCVLVIGLVMSKRKNNV